MPCISRRAVSLSIAYPLRSPRMLSAMPFDDAIDLPRAAVMVPSCGPSAHFASLLRTSMDVPSFGSILLDRCLEPLFESSYTFSSLHRESIVGRALPFSGNHRVSLSNPYGCRHVEYAGTDNGLSLTISFHVGFLDLRHCFFFTFGFDFGRVLPIRCGSPLVRRRVTASISTSLMRSNGCFSLSCISSPGSSAPVDCNCSLLLLCFIWVVFVAVGLNRLPRLIG